MKRPVLLAAGLCLLGGSALAQNDEAPAPPAVPVGEVTEEPISRAAGQTIEGRATVIDGDELRVGDSLIRLFGIAAPDISSNLGPDARLYLQGLADGQHIICTEVDRNIEEQSIAVCTIEGIDLATELLAQGLAAVYRVGAPPTVEERELAARYDTEEADARERKLGIWAPRDAAPAASAAPKAPPLPTLVQDAIPKWLELAPLFGLIALLGIIGLIQLRRSGANGADGMDVQVLTAALLAEVSAIRDAAQEQYDGTAALLQEHPIPTTHHGLLSLPDPTVFTANADRLDILSAELATRLVRFHAMRDGTAHLLGQLIDLPCDVVRAALHGLTRSADDVLNTR
ncbi:MAG TPA: thermonuclease family protein [Dongiaceae bacterium]|nr:thermonuclease family protein [Dongiaceae bacterium]